MSTKCGMRVFITVTSTSMRAAQGSGSTPISAGELLDTLGGLDRTFLDGDRAVTDDRHIADGYRMLATTLGVAFDTYLFADPSRPVFVEVNSPFRPRPPVGWRQHRRLLPHVPGRSRSADTASAATRATASTSR